MLFTENGTEASNTIVRMANSPNKLLLIYAIKYFLVEIQLHSLTKYFAYLTKTIMVLSTLKNSCLQLTWRVRELQKKNWHGPSRYEVFQYYNIKYIHVTNKYRLNIAISNSNIKTFLFRECNCSHFWNVLDFIFIQNRLL